MDNMITNPNQQILFHPINDDIPMIAGDETRLSRHVNIHYRKYLFGLGALCGFAIALTTRVFFGTSVTTSTIQAGYETPLAAGGTALVIFNQMDAIAHERDDFLHLTGKIYTLSGETLFKRYDTIFHVLDNAYHRSLNIDEKIKRADRLEKFWKIQQKLFDATQYSNPEQERIFNELDASFIDALSGIDMRALSGINIDVLNTAINQIQ